VATLLGISAAGVTSAWSFCYAMNDEARKMQAARNILEQEIERARRVNWLGLPEQTSWVARYYYDSSGRPLGAVGSVSGVSGGYTSHYRVETLNKDALSLSQTPTVDASGGVARSVRRMSLRVQPTGVAADAAAPLGEAETFLTLGGP
jgi:hypothetical protein